MRRARRILPYCKAYPTAFGHLNPRGCPRASRARALARAAAPQLGAEPPRFALAKHLDLAVALDDGKARRICRDRFPQVEIVASAEIFAHANVGTILGADLSDAVHGAMLHARMRVLPEHREWVARTLGARADAFPLFRKSRG